MTTATSSSVTLNLLPTIHRNGATSAFEPDMLESLSKPVGSKAIPPKHLYDARGSELFEQITRLDAYYLSRTETAILKEKAHEIASAIGPKAVVIEPGSGAAVKVPILLRALDSPRLFVPLEISESALNHSGERLAVEFADLAIQPICAGFYDGLRAIEEEPERVPRDNRLVFFPGSTLGNMSEAERVRLLSAFATTVGRDGHVLVGIDMVKDRDVMLTAYDDPQGVSAAFGLNLITRLNSELGARLDPDAFIYEAIWSDEHERIEMRVVCEREQVATICGHELPIETGEAITTEHSCKFTRERMIREAAAAGLNPVRWWTDEQNWFGMVLLETP